MLFADRQTAEVAEFPSGWCAVVGDTAEAPAQAVAADSRRSLHDLWVMRRLVQRESLTYSSSRRCIPTFLWGGRSLAL